MSIDSKLTDLQQKLARLAAVNPAGLTEAAHHRLDVALGGALRWVNAAISHVEQGGRGVKAWPDGTPGRRASRPATTQVEGGER